MENFLSSFRSKMLYHDIDCAIITNKKEDMFSSSKSNILPNVVSNIINFQSSSYIFLLTHNHLTIMVDGRYTSYAEGDFKLRHPHLQESITIITTRSFLEILETLNSLLPNEKAKIWYDDNNTTINELLLYQKFSKFDFVAIPDGTLYVFEHKNQFKQNIIFLNEKTNARIEQIRNKKNAKLVSSIESISWLLGIRDTENGYSIAFNGILLIMPSGYNQKDILFQNEYTNDISNTLFDVSHISELEKNIATLANNNIKVEIEHKSFPTNLYNKLIATTSGYKHSETFINSTDLSKKLRAIKTPEELKNIKVAHKNDALAFDRFFEFITNFKGTSSTLEEDFSNALHIYKAQQRNYIKESFSTISALNENAALPHYNYKFSLQKPSLHTCHNNSYDLYLIDAGSQYTHGTTDVTRTILLKSVHGKFSENDLVEIRKHFTIVLKSHIMLASAIFPEETTGAQLDSLARYHIWQQHLDYQHSTGHGVGFALNVHEGPYYISQNCNEAIVENVVLSIEPALYFPQKYGIRIENLYYVKRCSSLSPIEKSMLKEPSNNSYMCFIPLTIIPFDSNLIEYSMLQKDELEWLERYNRFINLMKAT